MKTKAVVHLFYKHTDDWFPIQGGKFEFASEAQAVKALKLASFRKDKDDDNRYYLDEEHGLKAVMYACVLFTPDSFCRAMQELRSQYNEGK